MSEPEPAAVRPRRRWRRWLPAFFVLGVAVIIVAGVAVYAATVNTALTSNLRRGASMPPASDSEDPSGSNDPNDPQDPSGKNRPLNFVLMGSDSRDAGNSGAGRSDVLIMVHLTADRTHAYVISFPRDMWVDVPGHGKAKINAAYAYGGTALSVQTLQDLTSVKMNHLAVVDFDGFIGLTEELGGVTIWNDFTFETNGMSFPRGDITISGEEALTFVRERHKLPRGDLDRAENQRKVVKAIMEKGLSRQVLTNPARFTAFVGGVARYTTVDDGLTDAAIRKIAVSLRLKPSGIVTLQAPDAGTGTSSDGQSIVVVDQAKMTELSKALKDDTVDEYVARHPE